MTLVYRKNPEHTSPRSEEPFWKLICKKCGWEKVGDPPKWNSVEPRIKECPQCGQAKPSP